MGNIIKTEIKNENTYFETIRFKINHEILEISSVDSDNGDILIDICENTYSENSIVNFYLNQKEIKDLIKFLQKQIK